MQDDRAADAAFVDARFRRLEQLGAGQHVRRQQGVVEGAGRFVVGFRGGDEVAVQLGQGQVRREAAHADTLALTTAAGDDHAGHALQCVGDVLVGEFADVFGGDHFDHRVGIALLLKALFNGVAVAGDLDAVQRGGILRAGGRGLLRGGASRNDGGGQCQRDGQRQCVLAMRAC